MENSDSRWMNLTFEANPPFCTARPLLTLEFIILRIMYHNEVVMHILVETSWIARSHTKDNIVCRLKTETRQPRILVQRRFYWFNMWRLTFLSALLLRAQTFYHSVTGGRGETDNFLRFWWILIVSIKYLIQLCHRIHKKAAFTPIRGNLWNKTEPRKYKLDKWKKREENATGSGKTDE